MGANRAEIREYVAGKLGRLHLLTATEDAVTDTLLDVPGVSDITADDERLEDAFVIQRDDSADPEWRRITSVNTTAEQLSINRAFTTLPAAQSVAVLGLLDPDEWNAAIDEALIELYFPDRVEITLTTHLDANDNTVSTREYDLPEWFQTRGQLRGLRYRNVSTGREEAVPRYRIQESQAGVRIVLLDNPWPAASYVLVAEGLRWHRKLADDTYETSCPQQLWQSAVEVSAIHKLLKKYGERFKRTYAMDLAIAERKLAQMRAAILPPVQANDYNTDDDWGGPDIDSFFLHSGWDL